MPVSGIKITKHGPPSQAELELRHRIKAADRDPFGWFLKLARAPDERIASFDIAEFNLLAGTNLPKLERLNILKCLDILDAWMLLIQATTERELPHFEKNPSNFWDSLCSFKMLVMVTVLQRDLGVRYYLPFSEGDYDARDCRNHFIYGIISGHGGTCATLPMLYVAIGRRLGYPLFLVHAKEHLFVRWEGQGERFNIEATSLGFEPRDDAYFRDSPRPLTTQDLESGKFLKTLTKREELAISLYERGWCLRDNLHMAQALSAFLLAKQFNPGCTFINAQLGITEVLWKAFDEAQDAAKAKGRDRFELDEVAIQQVDRKYSKDIVKWAVKDLKRMKRIHGRAALLCDDTNLKATKQQ